MSAELRFTVRSFKPTDIQACQRLYVDGLLGGKLAENDTGLDIDDIESSYMTPPGNHFWVAELTEGKDKGLVVGMIGLIHPEPESAEIRRLRVHHHYRRQGIGSALMEKALKYCQDMGYLKIMLDTFIEREPAVKLFEKFHFRHNRTRKSNGKDLLYFYLDLYTGGSDTEKPGDSSQPREHIEPPH